MPGNAILIQVLTIEKMLFIVTYSHTDDKICRKTLVYDQTADKWPVFHYLNNITLHLVSSHFISKGVKAQNDSNVLNLPATLIANSKPIFLWNIIQILNHLKYRFLRKRAVWFLKMEEIM